MVHTSGRGLTSTGSARDPRSSSDGALFPASFGRIDARVEPRDGRRSSSLDRSSHYQRRRRPWRRGRSGDPVPCGSGQRRLGEAPDAMDPRITPFQGRTNGEASKHGPDVFGPRLAEHQLTDAVAGNRRNASPPDLVAGSARDARWLASTRIPAGPEAEASSLRGRTSRTPDRRGRSPVDPATQCQLIIVATRTVTKQVRRPSIDRHYASIVALAPTRNITMNPHIAMAGASLGQKHAASRPGELDGRVSSTPTPSSAVTTCQSHCHRASRDRCEPGAEVRGRDDELAPARTARADYVLLIAATTTPEHHPRGAAEPG